MSLRGERRSWETEQRKARKLKIPEQPEVLEGDDDDEEEEDELPKREEDEDEEETVDEADDDDDDVEREAREGGHNEDKVVNMELKLFPEIDKRCQTY